MLFPNRQKTVHIFICLDASGKLKLTGGGELPKIKEGTCGKLIVASDSIVNEKDLRRIQCQECVPFLPKSSELVFTIDASAVPQELSKHLVKGPFPSSLKQSAVRIELSHPLMILFRGTKLATLNPVNCSIPSLNADATSLNHAYRIISEKFEPNRISHSGSVFRCGYLKTRDRWMSLENIREIRSSVRFVQSSEEKPEDPPLGIGHGLWNFWRTPD